MNEIQIIQGKVEVVFKNRPTKELKVEYCPQLFEKSVSSDTQVKTFINLHNNHFEELNYLQHNLDSLIELKFSYDELINSLLKFRDYYKRYKNFHIEILPKCIFKIIEPISENERPLIFKLGIRL